MILKKLSFLKGEGRRGDLKKPKKRQLSTDFPVNIILQQSNSF